VQLRLNHRSIKARIRDNAKEPGAWRPHAGLRGNAVRAPPVAALRHSLLGLEKSHLPAILWRCMIPLPWRIFGRVLLCNLPKMRSM
jgi:hypothetical protein